MHPRRPKESVMHSNTQNGFIKEGGRVRNGWGRVGKGRAGQGWEGQGKEQDTVVLTHVVGGIQAEQTLACPRALQTCEAQL